MKKGVSKQQKSKGGEFNNRSLCRELKKKSDEDLIEMYHQGECPDEVPKELKRRGLYDKVIFQKV